MVFGWSRRFFGSVPTDRKGQFPPAIPAMSGPAGRVPREGIVARHVGPPTRTKSAARIAGEMFFPSCHGPRAGLP